ncbi:ABC-type transport auxiliary lipoprotein family protein [Undibacterium sp. Ren11W]|uniref:ABC-type transport auxiliary lipoprotein family protein n=1 Tax=Undibacterium sp. Ren11W TaxID=3413045 RepID=UPI003BF1C5EF
MISSTYLTKNTGSGLIFITAILLCACSILTPAQIPSANKYSFDSAAPTTQASQKIAVTSAAKIYAPTIVVSVPRAAAGFDSQHIVYVRQAHKLEYFQQSEWIETPASMLAPLVSGALERSARFSAVVHSPTSVMAQLRLDLEIVRLQQEFFSVPSQVRFTLRAHLLDTASRQVIAWREFDTSIISSSEDPYGGVLATNIAVRIVMEELAKFCVQTTDEQLATSKRQ